MGQSSTKGKKQTTAQGRIENTVGNIIYVNFGLLLIITTALVAYCTGAII